MKITDEIYGEEEITELVLIELINCDSIQRLKGISQFGIPPEYYHKKFEFNRFEHTIGVFILLRKLGATLEEQIAGLLHDISHTAFSHVIDWVLGDSKREDYQDNVFFEFLKNSEVPLILKKHNLDENIFSDLKKFTLLEREIPSLCADRIDYSLRELFKEGSQITKKIFSDLIVKNNQIVFKTREIAELFAREYLRLQTQHWSGEQAKARYFILSNLFKHAMNKKIISLNEFYSSEKFVLKLLTNSDDKIILENLDLLKKGFDVLESSDGIELKNKFRYVNPEIILGEKIYLLGDLSFNYSSLINLQNLNEFSLKKIKIVPLENEYL